MHLEMRAADVIVCRAGATTLAELAAAGKPAVLVPLPTATDDHQRVNARAVAAHGAAIVVEQHDLEGGRLAREIDLLARDASARERMGLAASTLARPDAATRIAARILELAGGHA
jgi:UDP-N-acetylglucosamine--N-acetylmuramyl-(pentapeptide) pyrophosphoryl-undecaprenol N-acetylglucosamine transferase